MVGGAGGSPAPIRFLAGEDKERKDTMGRSWGALSSLSPSPRKVSRTTRAEKRTGNAEKESTDRKKLAARVKKQREVRERESKVFFPIECFGFSSSLERV